MEKEKDRSQNAAPESDVLNKNSLRWLWKFTEGKRHIYLLSITLALLGVACMLLTYICLGSIIRELTGGNRAKGCADRNTVDPAVFVPRLFHLHFAQRNLPADRIRTPAPVKEAGYNAFGNGAGKIIG